MYKVFNGRVRDQVIVALPALGERKEMYEYLSTYLDNFKILTFDLPGHNAMTEKDFSISTYIEYIHHTLQNLNINTAHFIGNSIGAWVIQAFYQVYPTCVQSLTLLDGGYYFLGDSNEVDEELHLPVVERLDDLKKAVHETVYSMNGLNHEVYPIIEDYLLGNFIYRDGVYIHHSDVEALNTLSKEIDTNNYCLQGEISIPLGLLIAKHSLDELSNQKLLAFQKNHPNAKVLIIENGYHFLPITNPKDVANFIQKIIFNFEGLL